MVYRRFNPGCECCCPVYGYDSHPKKFNGTYWEWYGTFCCPETTVITDINLLSGSLLTDTLNLLDVFHVGQIWTCDYDFAIDESNWGTIADWVHAGGRIIISGEYHGCLSDSWFTLFNSFAASMGSTMSFNDDQQGSCLGTIPEPMPLTDGIPLIWWGVSATLNPGSGTVVLKTPPTIGSIPILGIEKIGSGVLMLTGDSNYFGGCSQSSSPNTNNCEFFKRFIYNDIDGMFP